MVGKSTGVSNPVGLPIFLNKASLKNLAKIECQCKQIVRKSNEYGAQPRTNR